MVVTQSDILDLFKKEKRPLLEHEIVHKFSPESEDEFEIVPNERFNQTTPVPIYIWVNTDSDSPPTKRKEPYIFHPAMLEEFWLNEILYILKKANDEVDIETIIDELGQQVVNYYGLRDPSGEPFGLTSDAGLGEEKIATLLKFLNKHDDKFYVRTSKMQHSFLQDLISTSTYMVGLVEWKNKVLENDRKIIRNEIIKVLRNSQTKMLSIKDLTYSINRTKLDTLTPKPFDVELIRSIVKENSGRLIYSMFKEEPVSLTDDLDYIINYFKKIRQPYGKFTFPKESSGLLAFIFIGNEFPLIEAQEYVNTRPIIYIEQIKRPELITKTGQKWLPTELNMYLESLFPSIEELDTWCFENLAVSFYFEHFDEVKLLAPKVIEHFSPLFNVDRNPGNLFQYTLKSKLEDYQKKNPNKKSPF